MTWFLLSSHFSYNWSTQYNYAQTGGGSQYNIGWVAQFLSSQGQVTVIIENNNKQFDQRKWMVSKIEIDVQQRTNDVS